MHCYTKLWAFGKCVHISSTMYSTLPCGDSLPNDFSSCYCASYDLIIVFPIHSTDQIWRWEALVLFELCITFCGAEAKRNEHK